MSDERSSHQILTESIMDWMKKHGQHYLPSYKELSEGLDIPNLTASYSNCKRTAFKRLQEDGYILEFSQKSNVCNARIIGYKPQEGISEKVAEKILNIDEETIAKPKAKSTKQQEDKPKAKLDEDMDEELDSVIVPHKTNSKQKTPFLFYSNKPVCTPRELENLGRMLISMAMIYEGKRLDVKVKITEGGEV